jgi:negative regulator of flagellin synthesis FlgM
MSNSIDSVVDGSIHRLAEHRANDSSEKARPGTESPDHEKTADLVDLTGRAKELQALGRDLARSGEFDAAKVESLRQAIAEGSYEVNAERIAEKLLAVDKQLP